MTRIRRPRNPAGRGRWLLYKIVTFVQHKGWSPSTSELVAYIETHTRARGSGSRWTAWRDLKILEHNGLVKPIHRRWSVTLRGFDELGIQPASALPRYERKPKRPTRKERERARLRWLRAIARVFDRDPPNERLETFEG